VSTYRLPARYRRRYQYRRYGRGRRATPLQKAAFIIAAAVALSGVGHHAITGHWVTGGQGASGKPAPAALAAIAFARHQIGCPYLWGGTGPCSTGFDCSGLVMMAYRSAGVGTVPRTTGQMWADPGLRHVRAGHEQPGDLALIVGADGTWSSPGHVGLVIGGGQMIEAWGSGVPIRVSAYGPGADPASGDQNVVGFVRPVPLVHPRQPTPPPAAGNVALGQQFAAQRGWTGHQWDCLYSLWQGESGWSQYADTRTTGLTAPGQPDAYGIAQAYPQTKMPLAGQSPAMGGQSDPRTQIAWGLGYIGRTYSTPCRAMAWKRAHGNRGY
jgi:cell wall-associated NlpC family hydrolase